ncbi:YadA-like family protein [Vreelandella andesensis]|uniref:YadA-like family protein n=1 Tax=Vreelandella andesensis TaxID=447567 RepID=UPI00142E7352|nr:YadA-like family protein [Halomonas andesensis]
MNNVFRLVWNRSLGRLVVASEAARSRRKAANCSRTVNQIPLLACPQKMLSAFMFSASITLGGAFFTPNNAYAYAVAGADACASNDTQIGIGEDATACSEGAIAIGQNAGGAATLSTLNTIAIGRNSEAFNVVNAGGNEQAGVAIGFNSATWGGVAIGDLARGSLNSPSVAIGAGSEALGNFSIAIGTHEHQRTRANFNQATAIGSNATAGGAGATALGRQASATGVSATALGRASIASSENSLAVGQGANALAQLANALGVQSEAGGLASLALGPAAKALAESSVAVGRRTEVSGVQSIGIGLDARATDNDAIAMGTDAEASATNAIAIGKGSVASGIDTGAIGRGAVATGSWAVGTGANASNGGQAFGEFSTASGNNASAYGQSATATGDFSSALGTNATAQGNRSVAIGDDALSEGIVVSVDALDGASNPNGYTLGDDLPTTAVGAGSQAIAGTAIGHDAVAGQDIGATTNTGTAIGAGAQAIGNVSIAISPAAYAPAIAAGRGAIAQGFDARASGDDSIAIGSLAEASAENAIAMGIDAEASATNAIAIGKDSVASGIDTGAIGRGAVATGSWAVGTGANASNGGQAFGEFSTASGNNASAYGRSATATGDRSSALGTEASAEGNFSTAVGYQTKAVGNNSYAGGYLSSAQGVDSSAIGSGVVATGEAAVVIGRNSEASGLQSFAVGHNTESSGQDSVALGTAAKATGLSSIAISRGAFALADYATALGGESNANAIYATAIGSFSTADAESSTAIGDSSNATLDDSVALGSNSVANTASGISGYKPFGATAADTTAIDGTVATQAAVDIGSRQITSVAAGTELDDAVNVSQLVAAQSNVEAGTNITNVTATENPDGGTIYTVNAEGASVSAGSGAVDVTAAAPNADNVTDYAVDLSQASKDSLTLADSALQTVVTQIDGTDVKTLDQNDNVANFVSGQNIDLIDNGGAIEIATLDNVTFTDIQTDTLTAGPVNIGAAGIDAGNTTISNVAPGTLGTDAVNINQLETSAAASRTEVTGGTNIAGVDQITGADGQDIYTVNADGASVSAGSGAVDVTAAAPNADNVTDYAVDLSQASKDSLTLADSALQTVVTQIDGTDVKTLDQNDNVANFVTGDNIVLSDEAGGIKIATSADLTADSLTINNGPTLNDTGINMNGGTITNLGDPVNNTDAANKQYVDQTETDLINLGMSFTGNDATAGVVQRDLGQTLAITGDATATGTYSGTNLRTVTDPVNGTIKLEMADSPQFGNVTINDGGGDTVNNLSNLNFDGDNIVSGQAATEDQLKQVSDIANTGWDVQTNGDTATNVAPGDTVQFLDGKNVDITRNGTDITVATADDVVFDSVTITNGPTLNDNGINMNGNTITNLGDPVNGGDAVNLNYFDENRTRYYSVNDNGVIGGNFNNDGATGVNAMAAGIAASATSENATAIGPSAVASGTGSAAIGFNASAQGANSFALGETSNAVGENSLALGADSTANTRFSTALGRGTLATGQGAIALGGGTATDAARATGTGAIAIGGYGAAGSGGANANVNYSVALGSGAQASASEGDVALGSGSQTATANPVTSATVGGTTYDGFAGTAPTSVVSVGSAGEERQITNVAAGRITNTSTDAINGSQLFSVVEGVVDTGFNLSADNGADDTVKLGETVNYTNTDGNLIATVNNNEIVYDLADTLNVDTVNITNGPTLNGNGIDMGGDTITNLGDPVNDGDALNLKYFDENRTRYYSVNDNGVIGGNFNNDGATGLNAIASGVNATASGDGAVAMGFGASAPIRDSLALGSGSVVDRALAPDSGFIPAGSATIEFNTTDKELLGAISVGDSDSYRQITNVADGTQAQDAVTVRQLQGAVGSVVESGTKYFRANSTQPDSLAAGEDSIAVGPTTVTNGDNGIGMGNGAIVGQMAPGGTAIGNNAEVLLSDGIAFGTNARSEAQQGIALGAGATVSHDQSVALGSNSSTEEAVGTSGVTIAGDTYTFAGTTPDSTVSIGSEGNERTLTNVAAGRVSDTSTDAINGSQLFASNQAIEEVSAVANTGWDVQTNGDTATNVAPGDTVQFLNGQNIAITRDGTDITVATADSVAFDDVTITGGPTLSGGGIDMNNTTISNLADGVNAQDAVNLSQLETSAAASKTEVAGGTNVASVNRATGADGQDIYTVNAQGTSVSAGSGAVDVAAAAPNADNVTDYAVDLSQASKDSLTLADSALQTVVTQIDGTDVKTLDQNDNVANFVTGDNIVLSDEAGGIKIATSADLTADSLTINNGPTLNGNGIDMGGNTITNLGDPVNDGDALNLRYFDANRTRYFSVNDNGVIGGNFNNDGATGLNAMASGIGATAIGEGAVAMGFGANARIRGSLALGSGSVSDRALAPISGFIPANGATIEFNTTDKELLGAISVGDADSYRQIINVADGTQAQDAVTVRQLQGAIGSVVDTGTKYFHANSTAPDSIAVGNDSIAVGPTTVTNGDNGIGMGNGAIVGQMAPGGTAIGNNAEVLLSDGIAFGTNARSEAQQGIALGAGATVSHDQSVALGSNSSTQEAVATQGITLIGNDYSFAGTTPDSTVSIGSVGNERTLTNVAAGRVSDTSTDAINGSQLFASNQAIEEVSAAANAGWNVTDGSNAANIGPNGEVTFTGDSNLNVAQTGVDDAGEVEISLNRDLDLDSVTSGNSQLTSTGLSVDDGSGNLTTVTNDGLVIAGGPSITASGGIDANNQVISNVGAPVNEGDALNLKYFDDNRTRYYSVNDGGTIGGNFNNDGATGLNAIASGVNATASGEGAVAMGFGASAPIRDSLALGSSSVVDRALAPDSGFIPAGSATIEFNTTDKELLGAVSVGDNDSYRQITNVADGTQAQDAVTVRQLQGAVGSVVESGTKYFRANSTQPDSLAAGEDSIAVGPTTVTNGDNGIGIGNGAIVGQMAPGGTAIGNNAEVLLSDGIAFGTNARSEAQQGIALGAGATVSHDQSVALGSNSSTQEAVATQGITLIGNDYSFAGTTPMSTVSVGSVGNERTITNVAAGRVGETSTDAINGSQLFASNQAIEEVSATANAGWNLSVEEGDASNVAPTGEVNLLSDDGNILITQATVNNREEVSFGLSDDVSITNSLTVGQDGPVISSEGITNVAEGNVSADSKDAINGSQLYATNQWIEVLENSVTNVVGDGSDAFITNNGRGIRYVRTNDSSLAVSDAFAQGQGSTAVGYEAIASADRALAMGYNAIASHQGSVALGENARTAAAVGTASVEIAGQTYQFAGVSPVATVSVGSAGAERTVTNVAAGRVSAESTDAINGSQLYATNQAVGALGNRVTNVEGDISNITNDLADLDGRAVAYDRNDDGNVTYDTITLEGDGGTTITNVAPGNVAQNSSDAVNGSQLWEVSNQITNIEQGGSTYLRANSEGPAADPQGVDSIAMGPSSVAAGDRSVASGAGAQAKANGSVALGADSVADREGMNGERERFSNESVASTQGAVSVGSAGNERQITNVAGGTRDTDAVNVRQLDAVQRGAVNYDRDEDGNVDYSTITLKGDEGTTITNVAPGINANDAANVGQLNELGRRFENEIINVYGRIDDVERNANAGSASAIAASTVPQAWMPGKSMVGVGAGTYGGESAISVGVSRLSDNGRWIIQGKVTGDSQSNFGAGIGAGWHW